MFLLDLLLLGFFVGGLSTGLFVGGGVSVLESLPCFADLLAEGLLVILSEGLLVGFLEGLLVWMTVGALGLLVVGGGVRPTGAAVGELEIVSNVVPTTLLMPPVMAPPELLWMLSLRLPSDTIVKRDALALCHISFPQLLHTVATIDLNLIFDSAVCKCLL